MSRIILPLDNVPWNKAQEIIARTAGLVWGYKIRRTILEKGVSIIGQIKKYGNVMVDFKLFDIPSAMAEAAALFSDEGADIITVHCTPQWTPPASAYPPNLRKIAGVTILTSMSQSQFTQYYRAFRTYGPGNEIKSMVQVMAEGAESNGYGYVVCSPQEVSILGGVSCQKICPGIRPDWYSASDDQERIATPKRAIENGADLLVIGRPILEADDMIEAIQKTNEEIDSS